MRLEDQSTLQGEAGKGEICQMQISQGPPHSRFLQHQCSPSTLFLMSFLVILFFFFLENLLGLQDLINLTRD